VLLFFFFFLGGCYEDSEEDGVGWCEVGEACGVVCDVPDVAFSACDEEDSVL